MSYGHRSFFSNGTATQSSGREHVSTSVRELADRVASFAAERGWQVFHDPKNLAMAIASETGELCATLRWVSSEAADLAAADPKRREAIRHEIGDIAILLFSLCNRLQVQLDDLVLEKLAINATRYSPEASRGRADRPSNNE